MCNHNRILVVLVFGLPASGKTTLVKSIHEFLQDGKKNEMDCDSIYCWQVITDEIIPRSQQKEATESGDWKQVRRSLLQATGLLIDGIKTSNLEATATARTEKQTISQEHVPLYFMICEKNSLICKKVRAIQAVDWTHKSTNHVILVEDNLYYKSMRYEWIKMCREQNVALGAISCSSTLSECLLKNSLRSSSDCIPEEIIKRMAEVFEPPTKEEFYGHFIEVHSPDEGLESAIKLIRSAIEFPLEPTPDDSEQKEMDRKQTSSNLIHQLDHLLRIAIKEMLLESSEKQVLAKSLSNQKFVILAQVKQSKILLPGWLVNSLIKKDQVQSDSEPFDKKSMEYAKNLLMGTQM